MPVPGRFAVKHNTLVQGRRNQIDACPRCTLKPIPGDVDKTDACPGVILHIVPAGGGGGGGGLRLQLLSSVGVYV